jgi:hypothetical protein
MPLSLQLQRTDRWLPTVCLGVILLIGILIHDDYGISWDEPTQYFLGLQTWDYIQGKNDDLLRNDNQFINPVIAAIEVAPEIILKPHSERVANSMRHLTNFLICWCGLVFFYLLALRVFQDYRYALFALLMLVLTPRLFAHFFYNSKDMPFMALFVVNVYLLVSWIQKSSWSKTAWMGILAGLLTATRIAGLLFPFIFTLILILLAIQRKVSRRQLTMFAVFLLCYPVAVYLFFPSIWHHPFSTFINTISLYSHHPYNVTNLFMGETVNSLQAPRYYIPVWMAITLPIGWIIFFFTGGTLLLAGFLKKRVERFSEWIIIVLWFISPIAAAIILRTNTYDDGRHFFFAQPALILIAVFGIQQMFLQKIIREKIAPRLFRAVSLLMLVSTIFYLLFFMVRYHPFQYTYFNAIGRKYAKDYFDKDYWGLSYRNAWEFLAQYDKSAEVNVLWKVDPGEWNLIWLYDYDRQRMHRTSYEQCQYYITNYRSARPLDASSEKIYEAKVQGFPIVCVYKMQPPNQKPVANP